MPGKDTKCDLQAQIEKGSTIKVDVVVFSFTVQNVRSNELIGDEELRAAFEQRIKTCLPPEVGTVLRPKDVRTSLFVVTEPSSVGVQCLVSPPPNIQAAAIHTAMNRKIPKISEALAAGISAVDGVRDADAAPVKLIDVKAPVLSPAIYPKIKVDKKIPNGVFELFEQLCVLDDTRVVKVNGSPSMALEDEELTVEEIAWSFQKTAEVFKDAKLQNLFVLLVTGLQTKDDRSCNAWAGSLAPSALSYILSESPMKDHICRSSMGGAARQEYQIYASSCKVCVAIGIVACDVLEQWNQRFTPDDKAFLGDAAQKLGTWPNLTVGTARGLWDRSTCRYLVVDAMVRNAGTADAAASYLGKCPRDVVCSRFTAPWRPGPGQQASFLHLYGAFIEKRDCKAAEDLSDSLAMAYSHPSATLLDAAQDLMEDPEVSQRCKRDCLVAFASACLRWAKPPDAGKKAKGKKVEDEYQQPNVEGLEVIMLQAIFKEYGSRVPAARKGDQSEAYKEFGRTFEAAMLLSSGDSLWQWARKLRDNEAQASETARSFLRTVGAKHVASLLRDPPGGERTLRYDPSAAKAFISGKKVWSHNGRKAGYFTQHLEKGPRVAADVGEVLRMYLKLDIALSAGSAWAFIQHLEENSECLSSNFNRIVPESSALRLAICEDIKKGVPEKSLTASEIDSLLAYIGFFSPSFQGFLKHGTAVADMRDCFNNAGFVELASPLLEATLKLISLRRQETAGESAREAIPDICEQVRYDPLTGQLFAKVIKAVQQRDYREAGDGFDLAQFRDCAKELFRASQLLQYKQKQARGVSENLLGDVERVIDSFLTGSLPKSWVSSLRSLDTVIFTLEYQGKEDLQLAYEHFEAECKNSQQDQLVDLIRCVKKIYSQPLAGSSASMKPDMDIKSVIRSKAPKLEQQVLWRGITFEAGDWEKVLEIAGTAAEAMKKRYNVLMLPHHTQIITLLMFGLRICGAGRSGAGFRELPKTMLARVGTGEGKSLIIGMLAAFVAKKGMRAHVINDDRLLTQRDFATNEGIFKALGLKASNNPADLTNKDCSIVYCTGNDVEGSCLDSLTNGEVEKYEESLQEAVLIVDEVDGMVFDKGVTSNKLFEDRDFSFMVDDWLKQLNAKGEITEELDDFRAMGQGKAALQREVEDAFEDVGKKMEGRDYTKRGNEVYMMDTRTGKISDQSWSLWLEILKSQRTEPAGFVHYKYIKAILCRLQCFMSYSCIFGLTGSLGQSAEKQYLAEHYEAVTFNVPFFLDTCRADGGQVQGKRPPTHISEKNPLPSVQDQDRMVVNLAVSKCSKVPVLVIAKDSEAVERLSEYLLAEIREVYGVQDEGQGGGEAQGGGGGEEEFEIEEEEAVAAPRRVIKLLHNPRNPREFVELVGRATEPVRSKGTAAGPQQAWPVTVTTAEGGRGHDYRVTDPDIDENGGLLLILTWVPSSEREWIQFMGRTSRQDHAGQYAVLLNSADEDVAAAARDLGPEESFVEALLRHSDQATAEMLQGFGDEIIKGRLMHKLTSKYWTQHKKDKTNKRQDWDWKRLCEEYLGMPKEGIQKRFNEIVPPEVRMVVDAETVQYEGQWRPRVFPTPRNVPHPGDPGCLDSEALPPKSAKGGPASSAGAAGAASASSAGANAAARLEQGETYIIKEMSFFGMSRSILAAPEGLGPSPLLAMCNVLLLRNQLALPAGQKKITSQDLISKVVSLLINLNATAFEGDDPRSAETLQSVDVAIDILPALSLGLDLNYKFSGPMDFEHKRELCIFELLEVTIAHGWVVSPLDLEAYSIVSQYSFNSMRQRLADFDEVRQRLMDESGAENLGELGNILNDIQVMEEVPIIRDFLDRSALQLTFEGIIRLHESMGDRELAVFYRNYSFGALLKNKDELYLLCTDVGLLDTGVVWERLAAADSDTAYLDTNFRPPGQGPRGGAARLPGAPARGLRVEVADGGQEGGQAGISEVICQRCGIINQFPTPAPGQSMPSMRCGACGETQTL